MGKMWIERRLSTAKTTEFWERIIIPKFPLITERRLRSIAAIGAQLEKKPKKKCDHACGNQEPARIRSSAARNSSTGTAPGNMVMSLSMPSSVAPATIKAGVPLISIACIAA